MKNFYVMIILVALPSFLAGADVEIQASQAAYQGHWNTVINQIRQGVVDVNTDLDIPIVLPLLSLAINHGEEAIVNQLINLGADVMISTNLKKPLHKALERIAWMTESPIGKRIHEQNGEIAKYVRIITTLVQHGATPTDADFDTLQKVPEPLRTQITDILFSDVPSAPTTATTSGLKSSSSRPACAAASSNRQAGPFSLRMYQRDFDYTNRDQWNDVINKIQDGILNVDASMANGRTPLMNAILVDNAELVHTLLELGANVSAVDTEYRTPMDRATERAYHDYRRNNLEHTIDSHTRIIKDLFDHGAELGLSVHVLSLPQPYRDNILKIFKQDRATSSPSQPAQQGAGSSSSSTQQQQDFDYTNRDQWVNVINKIQNGTLDVNAPFANGRTPLMNAIRSKQNEIVDMLIGFRADVTLPNKVGDSPLRVAIDQLWEDRANLATTFANHRRIIRTLINNGATLTSGDRLQINNLPEPYKAQIMSIISPDVQSADAKAMADRLEAGSSSGGPSFQQQAFEYASASRWDDVLSLIKQKEVNVNAINEENGTTLLLIAVTNNRADIVNSLIALGADVNIGNRYVNETPLDIAIVKIWRAERFPQQNPAEQLKNSVNIATSLIQHGATQTKDFDETLKEIQDPTMRNTIENLIQERTQQTGTRTAGPSSSSQPIEPVSTNEVIVEIPKNIADATGMNTVTFNLDDNEALTTESYRELIDEDGTAQFIIAFSQDEGGKWYAHIYAQEDYNGYASGKSQADLISPANQQPIKHTLPITATKQGEEYEARVQ